MPKGRVEGEKSTVNSGILMTERENQTLIYWAQQGRRSKSEVVRNCLKEGGYLNPPPEDEATQ